MRKFLVEPSLAGINPYIIGWKVETPWAMIVRGDFPFSYALYDKPIFILSKDSNTEKALYRAKKADNLSPAPLGFLTKFLSFELIKSKRKDEESLENIIQGTKILGVGRFSIQKNEGAIVLAGEFDVNKEKFTIDYALILEKAINLPLSLQTFIAGVLEANTEKAVSLLIQEIKDKAALYLSVDEKELRGALKKIRNAKVEIGYYPIFNHDPLGEEMLSLQAIHGALYRTFRQKTTNLDIEELKGDLKRQEEIAQEIMFDYFRRM